MNQTFTESLRRGLAQANSGDTIACHNLEEMIQKLLDDDNPADADAKAWDHQIETDSQNGKLNQLIDKARADHHAGNSTDL